MGKTIENALDPAAIQAANERERRRLATAIAEGKASVVHYQRADPSRRPCYQILETRPRRPDDPAALLCRVEFLFWPDVGEVVRLIRGAEGRGAVVVTLDEYSPIEFNGVAVFQSEDGSPDVECGPWGVPDRIRRDVADEAAFVAREHLCSGGAE